MKSVLLIIGLILLVLLIPYHMVLSKRVQLGKPIVFEEKNLQKAEKLVATAPKVVLITIDGVRWQEIFNGTDPVLYKGEKIPASKLLPNLYHHFVDHGTVVGKESLFVASGPAHISLPGYLEIMRGRPSHDCTTNECEPVLDVTIADLFATSAVFGSWDTIHKAVSKHADTFIVNCGRTFRSQGWKDLGIIDDNTFPEAFDPLYRTDNYTRVAVLNYLNAKDPPQFLWVSLGDTDEWAHHSNYDAYLQSLIDADQFVGEMISKYGVENTTYFVTADHGRSYAFHSHGWEPESARDWLMMMGKDVPANGFVKFDKQKALSNIFPTVKSLVTGKRQEGSLL